MAVNGWVTKVIVSEPAEHEESAFSRTVEADVLCWQSHFRPRLLRYGSALFFQTRSTFSGPQIKM